MSGISFPYVNSTSSAGSNSISISWDMNYGDIGIAAWAAQGMGYPHFYSPPTSLTDLQGNSWFLVSTSSGPANNLNTLSQLWICLSLAGGTGNVLTFNGNTGVDNSTGPAISVAEYDSVYPFQIYIGGLQVIAGPGDPSIGGPVINSIDLLNTYTSNSFTFRAIANNGSPGGANCSDTGLVVLTIQPNAVTEEFANSNLVAIALINQFYDILIVGANYNDGNTPTIPPFSVTNGTLRTYIIQSDGNEALGLADGDFPYLNGPMIANCGNPPNGTVGISYTTTMLADGGSGSYSWSQVGGTLPPGLSLDGGTISGTPTEVGKFNYSIQVTDGFTIIVLNCSISICPASGSSGSSNLAYYSRH